MAMSLRTGICVSTETMEVTMAIPADGPSLGVAPSGTWTWMSHFEPGRLHPDLRRDGAHVGRRGVDDSFITSPSLPVVFIRPLPGRRSASIDNRSPPTEVQASPVTTPT
jgi:hypothetical protein